MPHKPPQRQARAGSPAARTSKTQRKREMLELQKLGEALVDMPERALERIELPEALREAVLAARRMTQRGAAHRQRQYIGRLMRQFDVEPIRVAVGALSESERADNARFHQLEQWREQLLRDGDPAIEAFLGQYPEADSGQLRRLVRETRRERAADRPPQAFRALFRYLRAVTGA